MIAFACLSLFAFQGDSGGTSCLLSLFFCAVLMTMSFFLLVILADVDPHSGNGIVTVITLSIVEKRKRKRVICYLLTNFTAGVSTATAIATAVTTISAATTTSSAQTQ